jgi:hypothetical protein
MQAEDALDMLIARRDQRHAESSPKRLLRIAQRAMRLSLRAVGAAMIPGGWQKFAGARVLLLQG